MRIASYECPMYHEGTFRMVDGKIVSFKSDTTNATYPIKRIEPESLEDVAYLYFNDSDFAEHLFYDAVIINHDVEAVVTFDSGPSDLYTCDELYVDACRVDNLPAAQRPTDAFIEACFDNIDHEVQYG
jgi:hypothetical protein